MSVFDKEISAEIAFAKVAADGTVLCNRGFASIGSLFTGQVTLLREVGATGRGVSPGSVLSYATLTGAVAGSVVTEDVTVIIPGQASDVENAVVVRTFNAAGVAAALGFTISQRVPTNQTP
jgi:hypothetical protein